MLPLCSPRFISPANNGSQNGLRLPGLEAGVEEGEPGRARGRREEGAEAAAFEGGEEEGELVELAVDPGVDLNLDLADGRGQGAVVEEERVERVVFGPLDVDLEDVDKGVVKMPHDGQHAVD